MSRFGFAELEGKEWLEADGLGGWASCTYSGANSRRYHGVLVAALAPPADRRVLLSKLDESLLSGGRSWDLADNRFPGTVPANAAARVAAFGRGLFPWVEFGAEGLRLRKTVAALRGGAGTLLRYELLPAAVSPPGEPRTATPPVLLGLRPFLAPRGIHELAHANPVLSRERGFSRGILRLDPYPGYPPLFVSVPGSSFEADASWWYRFQYERERERGLDFEEDLFTPGRFEVALEPGKPLDVLVSTADPEGWDASALWRAETARREALLRPSGAPVLAPATAPPFPAADPGFARRLALAADQFLVRRGADGRAVIAGYPWFEDWGRDTMVALRGLCLAQGRWDEARSILDTALGTLDQGMLPNRFGEAGTAPEYNTVDAALWLFVAVHGYWRGAQDRAFILGQALPALREALAWHERGTRFGIKVDADGLLKAGAEGVQLTWMDAKVGDWVVTPRRGKPVEVEALWINALRIAAELEGAGGDGTAAAALEAKADAATAAFVAGFWNEAEGRCHDVLTDAGPDPSPRPNQLFALSLPFPLLDAPKALRLLDWVDARLLTPRGLRSLAPGDPRYVPRYEGGVLERDGAYHQGTVWGWLLGPYLDAVLRFRGAEGLAQARRILEACAPHLDEAGLGSVSEIFDAEAPHAPKGCFAQAWSVGEWLRLALAVRAAEGKA